MNSVFFACSSQRVYYGFSCCESSHAISRVSAKKAAVKELLARICEHDHYRGFPQSASYGNVILSKDCFGRPILYASGVPGPSVSFSYFLNAICTAIGPIGSGLGIDIALSEEFENGYPLKRVLRCSELEVALGRIGKDVCKASSFLWSVKEAIVKSLGCGFHCLNPLDITVDAIEQSGYCFEPRVAFSEEAIFKIRGEILGSMNVKTLAFPHGWLSIALSRESENLSLPYLRAN